MERPVRISSGDAIRWNADVERRRREHHQRRCAEDPIYKRAYERQLEMMRRIQKMTGVTFAQMANMPLEAEDAKCRQATDPTDEAGHPQTVKTHEEAMRDQSLFIERTKLHAGPLPTSPCDCALAAGVLAMMLEDVDKMKRCLQELDEERPYADEIRKTDREFDSEIIRMSGFEW